MDAISAFLYDISGFSLRNIKYMRKQGCGRVFIVRLLKFDWCCRVAKSDYKVSAGGIAERSADY